MSAGDESRAIFEATVDWVWDGIGSLKSPVRLVYLRDVRGWVGTPRRFILQLGGLGVCAGDFEKGHRYLIDGGGHIPGAYGTNVCTLTQRIEFAAETIEELKILTGR